MGDSVATGKRARRRWRALPLMVLTAALVACGGGYGGMGSNYTPPTASAGPTGVSVGAITGFGSVHLNGKKFETTNTTINIDGKSASQADLDVGDVIEVKGHHDGSSGKDIADAIEMHSNVLGPVASIDATGQTLVVLGQSVVVSSDTSFGSGISPASLAGVAAGDVLRVSGLAATDGSIHATRIDRAAAGAEFHVIGTAASTDATAKTLAINALTVDFSGAALQDFPASGPKDGDLVEAEGTTLGSAGQLMATHLELRSGKDFKPDDGGEVEIEGLVTRFASATDFDVAGKPVTTSATTTFEGGTAADLALNAHVEVEGTVDATGLLTATKVRIGHAASVRMLAQVDAVDATGGTVKLLGITVGVSAMTRFEDHSAANVENFSLADVHTGDWLEVRGQETPAGSNAVLASRLERHDAAPAVVLGGAVKSATAPNFTILSVTVATTPTTLFRDASGNSTTDTTFFTGLTGQNAVAVGSWDGTTLTAAKAALGGDGENGDDAETEDH